MRLFSIAILFLFAAADSLSAQRRIPGIRLAEPSTWVSAGIGLLTGDGVNDGATQSTWDFGNSTNFQYRASLEKAIGSGSSFGLVGTYVRVPFVYSSTALTSPCGPATCEAHLDMMTLSASFHIGGGRGLHQVVEGNGGVAWYTNLTRDSDGAALPPTDGNLDPIFSLGWGLGYGFNENTQLNLVQDYGIALHEKRGLANGVSNTNTVRTLRFSMRFGFGARSRR